MVLSSSYRRLGLVAALVFLMAPVASYAQTGGLTGTVTLQDGSRCAGCKIIIERQDVHGEYPTKTDKHGKYIYIGLPLGVYKVTLEDPNGQVIFYYGNKRVDMGDPTVVDFNMPNEVKRQEETPEYQKQKAAEEKAQKQFAGLKELFTEGNALMAENKYDEAVAKFKEAEPLAKGKNLMAIDERLADAYAEGKKYDDAVATYQKVLQMNPDEAGIHNNLGSVYANMGKIDLAKAEFQKAADLDPKGAARYDFNLGVVLYNTGKMDDAAAAFKKATDLDATYAEAFFYLGQSLLGKATTDAAGKVVPAPGTVEAYQTYLKLQPNGPNADAAKTVLQTLEGAVQTQFVKKKKGH
jgi:tetratricopeptide (TPR) repeat protein